MRYACRALLYAVLLGLAIAGPAYADATVALAPAPGPLAQLIGLLLPVIGTGLTPVLLYLVHVVLGRLKLSKNAALVALVDGAVKRGAGLAYQFLVAEQTTLGNVPIKNVAIAKAVGYVNQALPDTVADLGLTPDHIEQMVLAELGKVLGADPTVSITAQPPAPATAPAPVAVPAAAAILLLVATLGLSACAGLPGQATVSAATTATISKAQADLQSAIRLYGIGKGIAQVATLADPALAPFVAGVTTFADPVVAQAQAALDAAATDAAAIEALTAQITAQANALTLKGAPAVTVKPNAPS